jgi:transketolase
VRLGLQDVYAHGASREHLLREHGLDAAGILRSAEALLGLAPERSDAEAPLRPGFPPRSPQQGGADAL